MVSIPEWLTPWMDNPWIWRAVCLYTQDFLHMRKSRKKYKFQDDTEIHFQERKGEQ